MKSVKWKLKGRGLKKMLSTGAYVSCNAARFPGGVFILLVSMLGQKHLYLLMCFKFKAVASFNVVNTNEEESYIFAFLLALRITTFSSNKNIISCIKIFIRLVGLKPHCKSFRTVIYTHRS